MHCLEPGHLPLQLKSKKEDHSASVDPEKEVLFSPKKKLLAHFFVESCDFFCQLLFSSIINTAKGHAEQNWFGSVFPLCSLFRELSYMTSQTEQTPMQMMSQIVNPSPTSGRIAVCSFAI